MDSKTTGNEFSQIIDNFLPEEEFNNIYNLLMGTGMLWNYSDAVDYEGDDEDRFKFAHTFFHSPQGFISPLSDVVKPFVKELKSEILIGIRANLTFKAKNNNENRFHYDHSYAGASLSDGTLISYTAIYYVNTNNGYTLFEDGNFKVDSVANRMVIFDSSKLHKAIDCTDEKTRVLINFNYFTTYYDSKDHYQKSIKLFNEANA